VRLDEVVLRSLEHDHERRYQHASEVRDRVVAIGPKHERTRPEADELDRRVAADRGFGGRVVSILGATWFIEAFAAGFYVNDSAFGYRAGQNWIPIWGYLVVGWLAHVVRLHLRQRKHRDTRLGHALMARISVAFIVGLVGLAAFITPSQGRYVALFVAALGAYGVWTEAVRHRIPARIVLGPSWWIHHWDADAEERR
jgi:hypothetical protein